MYLETRRLILRSAEPTDAEAYYELWNDPFVLQYNVMEPPTREQAAAAVSRDAGSDRSLYLQLKSDGRMIGVIDYSEDRLRYGVSSVNMSYSLRKDCAGFGYMPEACGAALRYAFEALGFDRVSSRVLSGNDRSVRVLEKLGFVCEGKLRAAVRGLGGQVFDDILFSISREEFEGRPTFTSERIETHKSEGEKDA